MPKIDINETEQDWLARI